MTAILTQVASDDEILVVDDGSTDDTALVVAAMPPVVRYIRQENAGKSAALNHGLACTSGEFVWICDDDDILLPNAVSTLVGALEDPEIDFAFGRYYPFCVNSSGEHERLPFYWPDLGKGSLLRHLLEDSFMMQNATLVRRKCYESVGPFDSTMLRSLDYDMFIRLVLKHRPYFVDQEVFAQRKHDGLRGPASLRHDISVSNKIWLEFDQRIFARLNGNRSLTPYQEMFRAKEPILVQRAALLQRACINARHGLWDLFVEDVETAAGLMPSKSLDVTEIDICSRMLSGKYDFIASREFEIGDCLRQLFLTGGIAKEVVEAMLQGGLWRFRRREGHDVLNMTKLLKAVEGVLGMIRLILSHRFHFKVKASPRVRENAKLPRLQV